MRVGVIQTGEMRAALAPRHGEYPAMFARLLDAPASGLALETVALVGGAPLPAPDAADAWLVTGSRHGVYDDLPWIAPLKAFLRSARAARRPIIGVCFGHQILAEAFGGRAVKHPGGWRLGTEDFEVIEPPAWMAGLGPRLTLRSVHQDQVVETPPDARTWLTREGCRHAGLVHGDPEDPDALSIQPHPEFTAALLDDLAALLSAEGVVSPELAAAARASGDAPAASARVGALFIAYLRRRAAPKPGASPAALS